MYVHASADNRTCRTCTRSSRVKLNGSEQIAIFINLPITNETDEKRRDLVCECDLIERRPRVRARARERESQGMILQKL